MHLNRPIVYTHATRSVSHMYTLSQKTPFSLFIFPFVFDGKDASLRHSVYIYTHRDTLSFTRCILRHRNLRYNGNTYITHLNKLIILNNKTLKILQNTLERFSYANLYIKYDTLTVSILHNFNVLLFVHKFFHHPDQLYHIFWSYFVNNSDLHKCAK